MCDWKTCPKVYHLGCLGREKLPPRGAWYCPWHFCTICGKSAVSHCIHCPNGYCKKHEDMLQKHKELGMICDEHKDDLADLVKFYRKTGGVKHLITHPNVPVVKTNTVSFEFDFFMFLKTTKISWNHNLKYNIFLGKCQHFNNSYKNT